MSEDKNIGAIYQISGKVAADPLLNLFTATADPAQFDYGQLYAYAQARSLPPTERSAAAAHFLNKIREKSLDNDTIRTILETQDAALPLGELFLVTASALADADLFEKSWRAQMYLQQDSLPLIFDAGFSAGRPYAYYSGFAPVADWNAVLSLPFATRFEIARRAAEAADAVHRLGLTHGALRPLTILLARRDDHFIAQLLLPGLVPALDPAIEAGGGAEYLPLFAYTAPEILAGAAPSVGGDVYALGLFTYFLLAGRQPWAQCVVLHDLLEAHKRGSDPFDPEELSLLPEAARAVIKQAANPDASARYATAAELAADLAACGEERVPQALRRQQESQSGMIPAPAVSTIPDIPLPAVSDAPTQQMSAPAWQPEPDAQESTGTEQPVAAVSMQPSPLFANEPEILNIADMNADLSRAQRNSLMKVAITLAVVLGGGGLAGYYISGAGGASSAPAPVSASTAPDTAALPVASVTPTPVAPEVTVADPKSAPALTSPVAAVPALPAAPTLSPAEQFIKKGNAAMVAKDYAAAEAAFAEAVKLQPAPETEGLLQAARAGLERIKRHEAALQKASGLIEQMKLEEAEAAILEVLSMPGYAEDAQAQELLKKLREKKFTEAYTEGEKLLAQKKWKDAGVAFAWALSVQGFENDARALKGRDKAAIEQGKIEEEIARKERVAAQARSKYNAAIAEAKNLESERRWEEAIAAYGLARQVEGYNLDTTAMTGQERAKTALVKAKEEANKHNAERLRKIFDAQIVHGRALLAAKKWGQAEEAFARAAELEGFAGNPQAKAGREQALAGAATDSARLKYDGLLSDGLQLLRDKKQVEATNAFRAALGVKGYEQGELARQFIQFAELQQKAGSQKSAYETHLKQGDALMSQNQPEDAALEYGRAIVADPAQFAPHIRRGAAYIKARNFEKALASFKQLLNKNPNLPAALAGEITALIAMEKYEDAQEGFEGLLKIPAADRADLKGWTESTYGWMLFNPGFRGIERGDIKPNNEKAVELFRLAAAAKNAEAQNNLGVAVLKGKGAKRDAKEAAELFTDAATAGNPAALYNLGMLHLNGEGAPRDLGKAIEYFEKSSEAGFGRASGRLAEIYQRGKGVEKNPEKAREYAEKFGGKTDREDDPAIAAPGIGFVAAVPANTAPVAAPAADKEEIARQFRAVLSEAKRLLENRDFPAVKRTCAFAQLLEGYDGNAEARSTSDEADRLQGALEEEAARTAALVVEASRPAEQSSAAGVTKIPAANDDSSAARNLPGQPGLPALPVEAGNPAAKPGDAALTGFVPAPALPDVSPAVFQRYYINLIDEGRKHASARRWGLAEQAYRLALAVPGSPSDPKVAAAFKVVVQEKKKALDSGAIKNTDYEAMLGTATGQLRERQWPVAISVFQSALKLEGFAKDPVGNLGLELARKAADETAKAQLAREPAREVKQGDGRDMASYKLAMEQAQGFMAAKNYNAAIQMAKIVLGMPGFENDPNAKAILDAAQTAKLETENSPEAIRANREKNKGFYDNLILTAQMHFKASDWEKATQALNLILKLPGYANDADTMKLLEAAKEKRLPADLAAPNTSSANPQLPRGFMYENEDSDAIRRKAEFDALMREAKRQFELAQYEVADTVLKEALKIKGYENNPEALALLQKAQQLKPKAAELKAPVVPEDEKTDPRAEMKQQADLLLKDGDRMREEKNVKGAIQAYSSGLDLDSEHLQLRLSRGDTFAASGQFSLAIADYERALKNPLIGGDQQSHAWNNLANVYYYGLQDFPKAFEFYTKAAQAGSAPAMNSLGVCYGAGKGVAKNEQKAVEWYKEAAAKGYGNAMLNLGLIYQNGWGVTADPKEAFRWYEDATKQNIPRAFLRVALMCREGVGTDKDEAKAAEYEKKARELGYTKDR